MYRNFKIIKVDSKYCDYLRKFDNKVVYNAGSKELRPFIGILFNIDDMEYYAPLSSPKLKHTKLKNNIDLFKIDNGRYGVVNFNNMIPVMDNNYEIINLNGEPTSTIDMKRLNLLREQRRILNSNYKYIKNKANKLYNYYINNKLHGNVKARCCNFPLLEEKCIEYNK